MFLLSVRRFWVGCRECFCFHVLGLVVVVGFLVGCPGGDEVVHLVLWPEGGLG